MFDSAPHQRPVTHTTVLFKAPDGAELVGTLYQPDQRPFAAVVLNSATGVRQEVYTHFARWLAAERGMAVLTYDYRDFGRSAGPALRRSQADMIDWGITDQIAARRAMRAAWPGVPLWVIGHSLGAMLLPNQPEMDDVVRVVGVASGMVHHHDHPWPYRLNALNFWFALGPVATAICGYLPARALRIGEDLPAGVFWQWRRWCTTRAFYAGDLGPRLAPPDWQGGAAVTLCAFADDALIPPAQVARLRDVFGAQADLRLIAPQSYGLQSIGHIGVFSRRCRAVWPDLIAKAGPPDAAVVRD